MPAADQIAVERLLPNAFRNPDAPGPSLPAGSPASGCRRGSGRRGRAAESSSGSPRNTARRGSRPGRWPPAGQTIDVLGMVLVQPLHQGTAGVQRDPQIGGYCSNTFKKRQVAVLVRLFENAVEVADGLVVVQYEAEANSRVRHGWSAETSMIKGTVRRSIAGRKREWPPFRTHPVAALSAAAATLSSAESPPPDKFFGRKSFALQADRRGVASGWICATGVPQGLLPACGSSRA